ncbi:MAG: biotin transporter BioY [Candidatus Zixiibacteriota bacterium]|jgi:biotin transport system substrate-specific component
MRVKDRTLAASSAADYDWILKLAGALLFVTALGLSAAVRVPLPFTPVPVTMQTYVVLMAGAALGVRWGVAAVLAYVAAGIMGAPFFAGGAGWAVVAGATGGYLVGFVPAVVLAGLSHGRAWYVRAACFLGALVTVYAFGLGHLVMTTGADWGRAFALGCAPFLPGAAAKYVLAVASFGPAAAIFKGLFLPKGAA